MPTYNYLCTRCGPFSGRNTIARYDQPLPCPACGVDAPRALSVPQALGLGKAREASASAAGESGYQRLHAAGRCSCCGPRV